MKKNIKLARERIAAALRLLDSLDAIAANKEKRPKYEKACFAEIDARYAHMELVKAERSLQLIMRDAKKEMDNAKP